MNPNQTPEPEVPASDPLPEKNFTEQVNPPQFGAGNSSPINSIEAPPPIMVAEGSKSGSGHMGIFMGFIGGLFSWLIIPMGIVLVLHLFVFQAFHVVGNSMIPTLKDSDYLIVSKLGQTVAMAKEAVGDESSYIPPRNEIIVFKYPKDPNLVFVKRVIGLPGDRVLVDQGKVRVFTKEKPEGFDPTEGYEVSSPVTLIDTDTVVPPKNVFVLGDNRTPNGSSDSREWGPLPSEYIIGNAVARLIPIDKAQIF